MIIIFMFAVMIIIFMFPEIHSVRKALACFFTSYTTCRGVQNINQIRKSQNFY